MDSEALSALPAGLRGKKMVVFNSGRAEDNLLSVCSASFVARWPRN